MVIITSEIANDISQCEFSPAGDAEKAGSLGTLSSGKRTNANQEGSVSEILHHANIHAGYK